MISSEVISTVLSLATQIHAQYEQMQDNKESCSLLNTRVDLIAQIVGQLDPAEPHEYCQRTLEAVSQCLEQCLTFISTLSAKKSAFKELKAFLQAQQNKALIEKLGQQLQEMVHILNLALNVKNAHTLDELQAQQAILQQAESDTLPQLAQTQQVLAADIAQFVSQASKLAGNVKHGFANVETFQAGGDVSFGHTLTPQKEPPPMQTTTTPETLALIQSLIEFFRDGEDAGEKTPQFEAYKAALKGHHLSFAYNKKEQQHYLYDTQVDSDEPIAKPTQVLRALKGRLEGQQAAATPLLPAQTAARTAREAGQKTAGNIEHGFANVETFQASGNVSFGNTSKP